MVGASLSLSLVFPYSAAVMLIAPLLYAGGTPKVPQWLTARQGFGGSQQRAELKRNEPGGTRLWSSDALPALNRGPGGE